MKNLDKKEFYSLFDLREIKGLDNRFSHLSFEEKNICDLLNDSIKQLIYSYSIFMKNNCKDVLEGDFSSVGDGTPF